MTRLQSFLTVCALALVFQLAPSDAAAQQQGTVYLNDGSVLVGQVLELVPGDHITLQIGATAPVVIPYANIARVEVAEPVFAQPFAPQPVQQPYVAPQQTPQYQLQDPAAQPQYGYAQPPRRRPGLGLPITFLSIGAVMLISGGVLISTSNVTDYYDYYDDNDGLFLAGAVLAGTGGVFLGLGVLFLVIRLKQRRNWSREQQGLQYGLAPIIAPEQSLYGLQGMVSF